MTRLDPDHLPPRLTLCTDPDVWAEEFLKVYPMSAGEVATWFNAAMETKRMMAIASLPLPPRFFK